VSAIETITQYQALWRVVMPHIAVPPAEDVALWCGYPVQAVEGAILRTARRFSRYTTDSTKFSPVDSYRYTSSVARAMAEEVGGRPTATHVDCSLRIATAHHPSNISNEGERS
jgi:hypothetical protein